jgi:hypothetical protein
MRTVTFSDGFVSTAPPIVGADQETYPIDNNQAATTLFTIDSAVYKSAFIDFELTRKDDFSSYIQTGSINIFFNGTEWIYSVLMTQNDDILSSALDMPQNVMLTFTTLSGVGNLSYSSGAMLSGHAGSFKATITRIKVL